MVKTYLYKIFYIHFFLSIQLWVKAQSTAPATTISTASRNSLLKDTALIIHQLQTVAVISTKQPDSAMLLANQALESSKALGFKTGIAGSLLQIGILYQDKSDFLTSIQLLQSALPYCGQNTEGNIKKTSLLYFIGDAYWYNNKPDSAALYYYSALEHINSSGVTDAKVLVETYSKLILLWVNLNDNFMPTLQAPDEYTASAVSYFNKSVQQQGQTDALRLQVLLNQGHIKRMEKKYDSARLYYRQYLQLTIPKKGPVQVKPNGWVVASLLNITESYLEEKKSDSAIFYAGEVVRLIGEKKKAAPMYYIVAQYFIGKALCQKKKYAEAIAVTSPALNMALGSNNNFVEYMAHEVLSISYGAIGQYQQAWEQQKIYTTITDSLKKNGSIQAAGQMEMRYRMAENKQQLAEKELSLIKKDSSIKNQRYLIAAISSCFLLALLTGLLLYRHNSNKQRIKLLKVETELELSHLNAMMEGEEKERSRLARELHDGIGGLLGSIKLQLGSALKTYKTEDRSEDFNSILGLLEGAYVDLRKTAHNLMPETLQQEGLEKAARLFCRGINKGGKTEILFETVGEIPSLPPSIELTLYRIMQELVHNIIKHAVARRALVQLEFINGHLALTVEDDGIGVENKGDVTHAGMGLQTIRNRVRSLGGNIDISGGPGEGTSVYIELEINK